MEILKYLLTFYNKEDENDMIGMWLPVIISEWEKARDQELPVNKKYAFAFHVAEYLLWES